MFFRWTFKSAGYCGKRHTIPILANVLIEAKNNEITITATDLEVGLKSKYEANIINEGKITISAKKLYEIIKNYQIKK